MAYALVRGAAVRITRLGRCGGIGLGTDSAAVSRGIVRVSVSEETDTSDTLTMRDDRDGLAIVANGHVETTRFTVDIDFCGVDPSLYYLMTGQPVVLDSWSRSVGFSVNAHVDTRQFGFAMEVWSRTTARSSMDNSRTWGYTLFPRLKGGRISGFTIENGALNFKMTGAITLRRNKWGVGPWPVQADQQGQGTTLAEPVNANQFWMNMLTTVGPPAQDGLTDIVEILDNGNAINPGVDEVDGCSAVDCGDDEADGGFAYIGQNIELVAQCAPGAGNLGFGLGPFGLVPFGH